MKLRVARKVLKRLPHACLLAAPGMYRCTTYRRAYGVAMRRLVRYQSEQDLVDEAEALRVTPPEPRRP